MQKAGFRLAGLHLVWAGTAADRAKIIQETYGGQNRTMLWCVRATTTARFQWVYLAMCLYLALIVKCVLHRHLAMLQLVDCLSCVQDKVTRSAGLSRGAHACGGYERQNIGPRQTICTRSDRYGNLGCVIATAVQSSEPAPDRSAFLLIPSRWNVALQEV